MRSTIYRGLHPTKGWLESLSQERLREWEVNLATITECTFKKQWCYQDPSVKDYIFEGDIVEVVGERYVPGEGQKSQFDGYYYIRAVVYYDYNLCAFCLDYDNNFNRYIMKTKGNEQLERSLTRRLKLGDYNTQNYWNEEEWQRSHNGHCHHGNIKVIGNIYQNPDLLKKNPTAVNKIR